MLTLSRLSFTGWSKKSGKAITHHSNSPRLARDAVILGPSAALNRDPTPVPSVNNTSETVPQLCVSQQSTTSQPPRLVSRSAELQEQGFSLEGAENCSPSKVINKDHLQVEVGSICEMVQRKFSVLIHSLCERSLKNQEFFMYLYRDLHRHPLTNDDYRTATVDTLGQAGLISQSYDLNKLLSSFHKDHFQLPPPKAIRNNMGYIIFIMIKNWYYYIVHFIVIQDII